MINCPNCKKETLEKAILLNVEVDYCTKCFGLWFDQDELRLAKDKKDENLNWLDIDLWRDIKKFNVSRSNRLCPHCRMPLYEVQYDKSKVTVDLCNLCKGIWLDKKEFEKIIKYLKEKADYEILRHFSKNLVQEFGEIFIGPEKIREEILDLLTLLKLLHYKFLAQHPYLAILIKDLPK
ncbi:zf-TFIIB domain-containing protein [Patescibacteria group bacterium]|nr:zf-TFIIB domain-containing protein [Patescibacteria group bacterium]MBU4275035.1 zf-TFIIB domain-containing protein [Patescibacteria group bacterium]MBU4367605.1 zf-TFIIB domain-containing protein [Patescibacteria group bacterium]MBU4462074.1 zf-TFIIB domain-containing protein [Patescibacteria group bacterium]MCG2700460.1 zf-TFIIB domain-containing protein [Candidatus Parcubacteria bacterium]